MKPAGAKDAAKTLTVQFATGSEDERSLEELIEDVRELVGDSVKRMTVFGAYYLIDGEAVRPENVPEPVEEKPKKKAAKKKEPEPDPELDRCIECDEEITDGEGYDGMCGNCADRALNDEEEADEAWKEPQPEPEPRPEPSAKEAEVARLARKAAPTKLTMKKR